MEAVAQGLQAQGLQGGAMEIAMEIEIDADLLVHALLAAWREEKAAMREEVAAPPA